MKIFLDTSILHAVYLRQSPKAINAFFNPRYHKFTSTYALKELRRVLIRRGLNQHSVNHAVDEIRSKCSIISTNSQHESGIVLADRSDIPIVAGARACDAVLVTLDHKLRIDASKYVKTVFPEEL